MKRKKKSFAKKSRKRNFSKKNPSNTIVCGRVIKNSKGFAFIAIQPPVKGFNEDIFLGADEAAPLITGDIVEVRVSTSHRSTKKYSGELIRIIKHNLKTVVGTFVLDRKKPMIEVQGKGMDLMIPLKLHEKQTSMKNLKPGNAILVKIVYGKNLYELPKGEIVSILGESMDFTTDDLYITSKHNLNTVFPKACVDQEKRIPSHVKKEEYKDRKDLRDMAFITIDGPTAKDFDDAVCAEKLKSGGHTLWVAIADVSHYVIPNSPIDKEAFLRGTSVYFPHMAVPMLPEKLSNGICSLKPNVDRLAVVCEIQFNKKGEVEKSNFYNAVIQSQKRCTYREVEDFFEKKKDFDSPIKESLKSLFAIYESLLKNRNQRGNIDLDIQESAIKVSPEGKPLGVEKIQRLNSHRLIEECMIAANEATAKSLSEKRVPIIFRVHEPPESNSTETFLTIAQSLGIPVKNQKNSGIQTSYQHFLKAIDNHPSKKVLNILLLRSLKQAIYSKNNLKHFALASDFYTHFTSPIRRYADLTVHRSLKATFQSLPKAKKLFSPKYLSTIAQNCSERDRAAIEAERQMIQLKQARYASKYLGHTFTGTIMSFNRKGAFVELDTLLIEGFVDINRMGADYVYNEKYMFFRKLRSGKKIILGDRIEVQIARVSIHLLKIELEPVAYTESKPHHHRRRGKRASR